MGSRLGTQPPLPEVDLSGKTSIVTGANTGIGYETAKALAQLGSKVIIACRSESKANEAMERMRTEHNEEKADKAKAKVHIKVDELDLEFMTLDLGSLAATMTFVEAFKTKDLQLHILVCNAGVMWAHDDLTPDGYEAHFQVNYLSHFLLILHLLPVLKSSGPDSRVVLVSSLAYRFSSWNETDIQCKNKDRGDRYSNSKLYQIMQMFSLAERLEGSGVNVFSLHPGVVDTKLFQRENQPIPSVTKFFLRAGESMKILRTPFTGALTSLHAAANPEYNGKTAIYFESSRPHSVTSQARNKEKQEILWKYSLECLKDYVTEETLKELITT
ncbi:retinol dehydrogenase 12-like isoform X2 [Diadema antillarum]|uniref:retinol dehydrogenase 12-like isoform X2 n=2 Tax=Diadema antillarum TaxID=105358 RepID=UPI003A85D6CE